MGCDHCYPAVALNAFEELAQTQTGASICAPVPETTWPPLPGDYFVFCQNRNCHVAVSTLASEDLARQLAALAPPDLCIVGKTETENIGIEKLIKNTITNPSLHFLLVAGRDPDGHRSGATLRALYQLGVDAGMRVIDSPGKRPVLKNSTAEEVEAFRRQVQVVDMIGEEDVDRIVTRMQGLASGICPSCGEKQFAARIRTVSLPSVETIEAEPPDRIPLDKAGYFVIVPEKEKDRITVEHYAYDNRLLRVIHGKAARDLYHTIVAHKWVSSLTHAAYIGKELEKAELSMKYGFVYVQDGA